MASFKPEIDRTSDTYLKIIYESKKEKRHERKETSVNKIQNKR